MAPSQHAGSLDALRTRIREDCRGKSPALRTLLLVPLALFYWGLLRDSGHRTIVSGINLVIHEGGHLFFVWFGHELLTVAGGTVFQVAVPALVAVMFFRQRDPFGAAVAVFWVGLSLAEVAPYAADARSQLLPLVSPFPGAPVHDWTYLLGRADLLARDQLVGKAFHQAGTLVMTLGLVSAAYVLRTMKASAAAAPEEAASPRKPQSPSQVGGSSVSSLNTNR